MKKNLTSSHSLRRTISMFLFYSASALLLNGSLSAAMLPVAPWTRDTGSATVTGNLTSSPIIGTGAMNSANATLISAPIDLVTLNNIGDEATFSGTVTFSGLSGTLQYGFRWGVFNTNFSPNVNNWLGYYAENGSGDKASRLWERGGEGSWWSATGATMRAGVTPVDNAFLVDGRYTFTMNLKLTGPDQVTINWSLIGLDDVTYSVTGSYVDNSPLTLAFNRVGAGNAGFGASQIEFSDISINSIPEPSTASLAGLLVFVASVAAVLRRRRQS